MRKPAFKTLHMRTTKDTDQPAYLGSLISVLCFASDTSRVVMITTIAVYTNHNFKDASKTEHGKFCLIGHTSPKTGFLLTGVI